MPNFSRSLYARALGLLSNRQAVSLDFFLEHWRLPRLHPPRTFNEKVIHRKLYDRDERFPLLSDKVLVKAHVAGVLGREWVNPTLWSGTALPPREHRHWPLPYVLKANHGSGWNLFVRSESDQNWESMERIAQGWLRQTFGQPLREWMYTRIKPQLLVEPYLSSARADPPVDFKVYVFGGRALYIGVDTGRWQDHRRCFFDREWNRQPFAMSFPLETRPVDPPASLGRILHAAEVLAGGFSFVRVDFYEVDGRPLFGEMTFYPGSGRERFRPKSCDAMLGELWPL